MIHFLTDVSYPSVQHIIWKIGYFKDKSKRQEEGVWGTNGGERVPTCENHLSALWQHPAWWRGQLGQWLLSGLGPRPCWQHWRCLRSARNLQRKKPHGYSSAISLGHCVWEGRVTPNFSKGKMRRWSIKPAWMTTDGRVADFMRLSLGFLSGPLMNEETQRWQESELQPNKSEDSWRQQRDLSWFFNAWSRNSRGWSIQTRLIKKSVSLVHHQTDTRLTGNLWAGWWDCLNPSLQ